MDMKDTVTRYLNSLEEEEKLKMAELRQQVAKCLEEGKMLLRKIALG